MRSHSLFSNSINLFYEITHAEIWHLSSWIQLWNYYALQTFFQLQQPLLRYHIDRELTQCKLATTASFPTPTTASTRSQRERIDTFQVGYNYVILTYYSLFANPNNLLYEIEERENWYLASWLLQSLYQLQQFFLRDHTQRFDTHQVAYNYESIQQYTLFAIPNNLFYESTRRESTPMKLATCTTMKLLRTRAFLPTPTTSSTRSQREKINTLQVGYYSLFSNSTTSSMRSYRERITGSGTTEARAPLSLHTGGLSPRRVQQNVYEVPWLINFSYCWSYFAPLSHCTPYMYTYIIDCWDWMNTVQWAYIYKFVTILCDAI